LIWDQLILKRGRMVKASEKCAAIIEKPAAQHGSLPALT
jgi:hypothetical protein